MEPKNLDTRRNNVFLGLMVFCITNALVAEIIGGKIFSVEKTLGIEPFQWLLWSDTPLSFNMTAGVLLWPFVFITTDLINEYFGKSGVRTVSIWAAIAITYAFVMIALAIFTAPADFWTDINKTDSVGNPLNINESFKKILGQGLNIIVASLVAFLIGQLLDAYIFQWIKRKTGEKWVWLRATGSTFVSQLIDSFLVLWIAFYVLPDNPWPLELVFSVCVVNYIFKAIVAVLLTPLLYLIHNRIDQYLDVDGKTFTDDV